MSEIILKHVDHKFGSCTLQQILQICEKRFALRISKEEIKVKFDSKQSRDQAVYDIFHQCYVKKV